MSQGHLQQNQTNAVWRLLNEVGLDPERFVWQQADASWAGIQNATTPCLVHRDGEPWFFCFAWIPSDVHDEMLRTSGDGEHWVRYKPGPETPKEKDGFLTWDGVLDHVRAWAEAVMLETDSADLWRVGGELGENLGRPDSPEASAPFSPEEKAAARRDLEKLADRLDNLETLVESERKAFREEIEELKSELESLTRRQWRDRAFGALLRLGSQFGVLDELRGFIEDPEGPIRLLEGL